MSGAERLAALAGLMNDLGPDADEVTERIAAEPDPAVRGLMELSRDLKKALTRPPLGEA